MRVSFANLTALAKKNKRKQPLADDLWNSGVLEARILATLVADPRLLTADHIDRWAHEANWQGATGYVARYVAHPSAHATELLDRWLPAPQELVQRCGYQLLAWLAISPNGLPDKFFIAHLRTIQTGLHTAPNHTREAMNGALIAIGRRNETLQAPALKAAAKIGPVHIDHGPTACKTPDATTEILKSHPRKKCC